MAKIMYAWRVYQSSQSGWTGRNSMRIPSPCELPTLHIISNIARSIKQAVAQKQKYLSFCADTGVSAGEGVHMGCTARCVVRTLSGQVTHLLSVARIWCAGHRVRDGVRDNCRA